MRPIFQDTAHQMPPPITGPCEWWPARDAGSQFRRGPACFAYAALNAALGMEVAGAVNVDATDVFNTAAELDGLPDEINERFGTTGDAALEALCQELAPRLRWTRLDNGDIPAWLFHRGPVVVALRWNYVRVGIIGTTARRSTETNQGNHAVALCGYEPYHVAAFGLGGRKRRPCYLVKDSCRRGKYWIPSADIHRSGDLLGAWGLIESTARNQNA
jgi:hypothetical protein